MGSAAVPSAARIAAFSFVSAPAVPDLLLFGIIDFKEKRDERFLSDDISGQSSRLCAIACHVRIAMFEKRWVDQAAC